MKLELKPAISAILEAQVAAGHYPNVEEAIAAAVLGAPPSNVGDLAWVKSYLAVADEDIEAGRTFSHAETFGEIEDLLGKK